MEFLPALLVVLTSYVSLWLLQRRVRAWRGWGGAQVQEAFGTYDHEGLSRELLSLLPPVEGGQGEEVVRWSCAVEIADGWRSLAWSRAEPPVLVDARDLLLAGSFGLAAQRAAGESDEAIASLFAWATLLRLAADQLEAAKETAAALADAAPEKRELAVLLLAWAELRRAERAVSDALRRKHAADASLLLHEVRRALPDGPAWAGLAAHLELLRFSLVDLEAWEIRVRTRLRRAASRHPEAASLHFLRAHLAARLGEDSVGHHLARSLYYAQGKSFYARPIVLWPRLESEQPTLVAEARSLLGSAQAARLTRKKSEA